MHDPLTQAFTINPLREKRRDGSYRGPLITIWHKDPEKDGTDDSCGWTFPKITKEEREYLDKVVDSQYDQLFSKKVALEENKSYASICYNQDCFGTIYWLWRHFNKRNSKIKWQYGKHLSNKDLQHVMSLATDPNDNFQHYFEDGPMDKESFSTVVRLVYRSWKRTKRKWYQHPKWHVHHWKVQFNFIQNIYRRYFEKCYICNERGFEPDKRTWSYKGASHQSCLKENKQLKNI